MSLCADVVPLDSALPAPGLHDDVGTAIPTDNAPALRAAARERWRQLDRVGERVRFVVPAIAPES